MCAQVIDLLCHLILANMQTSIGSLKPNEFASIHATLTQAQSQEYRMMMGILSEMLTPSSHIIHIQCVCELKHDGVMYYFIYNSLVHHTCR